MKSLESEFIAGIDLYAPQVVARRIINPPEWEVKEMIKNFTYKPIKITVGKRRNDAFTLGDFIPFTKTRNILIVTRGRSGSSFLGDLLSRYPGVFYSYEPLHFKDGILGKEEVINLVKQVFKCRPEKGFFEHAKKWYALGL